LYIVVAVVVIVAGPVTVACVMIMALPIRTMAIVPGIAIAAAIQARTECYTQNDK
jgi:hypothetical protein